MQTLRSSLITEEAYSTWIRSRSCRSSGKLEVWMRWNFMDSKIQSHSSVQDTGYPKVASRKFRTLRISHWMINVHVCSIQSFLIIFRPFSLIHLSHITQFSSEYASDSIFSISVQSKCNVFIHMVIRWGWKHMLADVDIVPPFRSETFPPNYRDFTKPHQRSVK